MLKEGKYYVCIGKPNDLDETELYGNMYGFNVDFKKLYFPFVPNVIYGPMLKDNFVYDSSKNIVHVNEDYEMYFKEIDVDFDNETMMDIAYLSKINKYLEIGIKVKPSYVSENGGIVFDVSCNLLLRKDYRMFHYRNINYNLKDSISRIKKAIHMELLKNSNIYKAINGNYVKKR